MAKEMSKVLFRVCLHYLWFCFWWLISSGLATLITQTDNKAKTLLSQDKQFCKSSDETNEGQNEIKIKWNSTKIESQFPWSPNLDYFLQDLETMKIIIIETQPFLKHLWYEFHFEL